MTTTPAEIWIADDEHAIRRVLDLAISAKGFATRTFEDGYQLVNALRQEQPSVILTDIVMPGMTGHDLMSRVKKRYPEIPLVVLTAYADLDTTMQSFEEGAFEFIAKPFDIEDVVQIVERAVLNSSDEDNAQQEIDHEVAIGFGQLIGSAPAMQHVFRAIARLARSNATTLITGESGTGKELVAAALHENGLRAKQPYVALNMAALPQELIEAELFGHEKGAFTGAVSQRAGRFEQAHTGTLFLDEIGDMPLPAQTRLLRVLAEKSFHRVGGRHMIDVDVRIIAATNQDLERLVADGLFREDLYHRLNVIRIEIPKLSERREDIELLANHFLQKCAQEQETEPKRLHRDTLDLLKQLPWPGNVRQLENVCQWLTVMLPSQDVVASDLPDSLQAKKETGIDPEPGDHLATWISQQLDANRTNLVQAATRTLIEKVMASANSHSEAARILGLSRATLSRRIADMSLTKHE